MELNKTRNGFYFLISFSVLMLLALGSWWLYLVFKLESKLKDLHIPSIEGNLVYMIQLEGITFFVFLLILTTSLLYIYIQDHRKSRSLQAFFASMTHELKTPLASMKLQSQVLSDHIEDLELSETDKTKLQKYTQRLTWDSLKLEDQLDNHLQLSRVERDASINMREINLNNFIQNEVKRYSSFIVFNLRLSDNDPLIKADDFALQTILRNLIENSIKHSGQQDLEIDILIETKPSGVSLSYSDNGGEFKGDISKLGKLFYKHNSPSGSGIGVYLIHKLMKKMQGECQIKAIPNLMFSLSFPLSEANHG